MITQDNYLDMYHVFVSEVFGNIYLFLAVMIILLIIMMQKMKIPYQAQTVVIVLFIGITYVKSGIILIWGYTLLAVAILFYYKIYKATGGRH